MALPKLSTPTFTLEIPSTKEKIEYRPFLVQEEKILLMALESNQQEDMIRALRQILNNCILTDVNVNDLATFDVEYIFSQLRSKSIGSTIELKAKMSCEEGGCPKAVDFEINLDELDLYETEGHSKKIELTEKDGIVMKYPSFANIETKQDAQTAQEFYDLIIECIDYIYDAENTYAAEDHSKSELMEYLNALTHTQFEKITSFFNTMPKIQKKQTITCPKCGKKDELVISGLENFFG